MKFKVSPIHVIAIIVLFVGSVVLSRNITEYREKLNHYSYVRQDIGMPVLGFDNFIADILWIDVIQELGSIKGKITKQQAEYFFKQFDKIARLDPGFQKALAYGGLSLSVVAPKKALSIIEKGTRYNYIANKKDAWKIPFYGAVIVYRYFDNKKEGYAKAIELCMKALDLGAPDFVERFMNLARVKLNIEEGRLVAAMKIWKRLIENRKVNPKSRAIYRQQVKELAKNVLADDQSILAKADSVEIQKAKSFAQKILKELEAPRCPSCGKKVSPDARFCPYCGYKLK